MPRRTASRAVENAVRRLGFARVAGVDEVGRGCLAGPVVVAAVVLDPGRPIRGIRDSKLLSAKARERFCDQILDRVNVHQASLGAMRDAVNQLIPLPDFVLVDGFPIPDLMVPQRAIVGGDRRCASIAAASIVAKVSRDRDMCALHARDPRYGFDRHKGYATAQHLAAVAEFGYSAVHRRSFRPQSLFDTIEDVDGPEFDGRRGRVRSAG